MSHRFDAITAEQLRATGGKKWTQFPALTGAWIAEMDFGTAPAVTAALQRASQGPGLAYLPDASLAALRGAFTSFVGDRYGWQVGGGDVHIVPDVLAGMQAAIRMFSRPGSPVILPVPAYMPFLRLPASLGREILTVPMARQGERYVYDLEALAHAFEAGGHMLILCNPHNPIGRVLEREELEAICAVVDAHGGRVFADEIHAPLTFGGRVHIPYASLNATAAAHAVTATSTSKAFNTPGLKTAQVVLSNDADRDAWEQLGGEWVSDQAATIGVLAATAAYADGGEWLDEVVTYLEGNMDTLAGLLAEHLPGVGYTRPEGTYLTWWDFRGTGIERPQPFFIDGAGVMATAGEACGAPGFLRFNAAMPRPLLVEAIERMGRAYRDR